MPSFNFPHLPHRSALLPLLPFLPKSLSPRKIIAIFPHSLTFHPFESPLNADNSIEKFLIHFILFVVFFCDFPMGLLEEFWACDVFRGG